MVGQFARRRTLFHGPISLGFVSLLWLSACASDGVQELQPDAVTDAAVDGGAAADVGAPDGPYAQSVVAYNPGTGAGFGQEKMPHVVFGGPQGRGASAGSLDVVSLGCGGSIVLGLGARSLKDGPGPDLVVYENPFSTWLELGEVAVSEDGQTWLTWPCAKDDKANGYPGCAGVTPVLANADNGIDPLDPSQAGGDTFDLATLGLKRANFVRITDLKTQDCVAPTAGFDLDAIALLHE